MYKTLINRDELVEQHTLHGNQFSKIDKITKKEIMDKEKPIDPKYIFDGKVKNVKKGRAYRKPKADNNEKKPIINLDDWGMG